MQLAFTDSIKKATHELSAEIVRTPAQLIEAQRLRYRVYCQERGFEAGQDGLEQDPFDQFSTHVIVRSRFNGQVYGTVRVARSGLSGASPAFPMEAHCPPWVLSALPRLETGEVSRFALTRDRTGLSRDAASLMRLCLIKGVVQICNENGLIHLCALMEQSLVRLLHATSIYFNIVGPTVEYRGLRRTATWDVVDGLDLVRLENPIVWSYITQNGRFAPPSFCNRISVGVTA